VAGRVPGRPLEGPVSGRGGRVGEWAGTAVQAVSGRLRGRTGPIRGDPSEPLQGMRKAPAEAGAVGDSRGLTGRAGP
jgi:hypothetical protein